MPNTSVRLARWRAFVCAFCCCPAAADATLLLYLLRPCCCGPWCCGPAAAGPNAAALLLRALLILLVLFLSLSAMVAAASVVAPSPPTAAAAAAAAAALAASSGDGNCNQRIKLLALLSYQRRARFRWSKNRIREPYARIYKRHGIRVQRRAEQIDQCQQNGFRTARRWSCVVYEDTRNPGKQPVITEAFLG